MNGLCSHHDEIQLLLRDYDIHINTINENKLDASYSTQLTRIYSFEHERKDRTSHGGGVAIYIKDSISYELRKDIPYNYLELICVEILSFLDKEEKEVILLGDTNCDFTVKEGIAMDSNAKHLTNNYELITEPTRATANSSSIIATTSPRKIVKAGGNPDSFMRPFHSLLYS